MIKKNGYFTFEIFKGSKELIQAVSSRRLGSMTGSGSQKNNRSRFFSLAGLKTDNLITMTQVHGKKVKTVNFSDRGKEIKNIDGLVTREKGLVLGIKSADCLPIIAFDRRSVLGTAHAGWKGIIKGVGRNLIEKMKKLGADPARILIGIGPHIGCCCYQVDKALAKKFQAFFGKLPGMVIKKRTGFYLDLEIPLIDQLVRAGASKSKIEKTNLCTFCQAKDFFSARREGQSAGSLLTVAAIKE
jgi:YfiH family protein